VPASNNSSIRFNCGKQVMIHVNSNKIFLKFLIHHLLLMKAKSGSTLHKSPELPPLKEKNFSHSFLLISTQDFVLKRKPLRTQF